MAQLMARRRGELNRGERISGPPWSIFDTSTAPPAS
jgi:hypothetical protein